MKPGGKLVIIDMEAAEDALRRREDALETLRDPSHVKNRSRTEFLALFDQYNLTLTRTACTPIPVLLENWLDLTRDPRASARRHFFPNGSGTLGRRTHRFLSLSQRQRDLFRPALAAFNRAKEVNGARRRRIDRIPNFKEAARKGRLFEAPRQRMFFKNAVIRTNFSY